ncbi:MAG: hypothetical protein K6C99_06165 [Lachnospiraceae bacterium]|nr:hypothetical protein [Lachnospiraceae bacterium]
MKKKLLIGVMIFSMFALTACGEEKETVSENEVAPVSTEAVSLVPEPEATPEVTPEATPVVTEAPTEAVTEEVTEAPSEESDKNTANSADKTGKQTTTTSAGSGQKQVELSSYYGKNLYNVMNDFYSDIMQSSNCFMWNDTGSWVHVSPDGSICNYGHHINTTNVSVYGVKVGQTVDTAVSKLSASGYTIVSQGVDDRLMRSVVRAQGSSNWVVVYYDENTNKVISIDVNLRDLDQGWD